MIRLRNLLLFCVMSAACDVDAPQDDDGTSQTEEGALVAPRDGEGKPGKKPGKPGPAPVTCDARQDRAKELLGTFQTCAVDADCAIEHVQAKCLGVFMCPVPVNKGGDLDALKRAASNASTQYQAACGSNCPVARCASPESSRVWCDAKEKRCKSELIRVSEDAGTPAEPVDAGKLDPQFGCMKDAECAPKNVGNCCGAYEVCANVNATFGPPQCKPGQVSPCVVSTVDSCSCRNNRCVNAGRASTR